jgi:hypothetical protein
VAKNWNFQHVYDRCDHGTVYFYKLRLMLRVFILFTDNYWEMHTNSSALRWVYAAVMVLTCCQYGGGSRVLMATLGGTKSHKIPFLELARGLIARGHNVTFLNAFPPDSEVAGLEEITPLNFVFYVRNYTNWDLLGARMSGNEAVPLTDALSYAYHVSNMR